MGLRRVGFAPDLLYENDKHAWATLRHNELGTIEPSFWSEHGGDVTKVQWRDELTQPVRLLAGGVPCQPFSLGGSHRAQRDQRNLFPALFRAIRELKPAGFLVENVSGLLREAFQPYFEYLLRGLEQPSLASRNSEPWEEHDRRLRKRQCSLRYQPEYQITWRLLNAADYGVPQTRRRVLIIGTRWGFPIYRFPAPTHSKASLYGVQKTGAYWEAHGIKRPQELPLRPQLGWETDQLLPWRTVRDAITDLPTPAPTADQSKNNHWIIPGARVYRGHTGSDPDLPSKTVKAGVHGVPGGENTLRLDVNGSVRYFTLREAATLQTFPLDHFFVGPRMEVTRQIGNAVPCELAEAVARPLYHLLSDIRIGDRDD